MTFDPELFGPPVFRAAPRGPGGLTGTRAVREGPSANLRYAALFAAAVLLLKTLALSRL